MSGHHHAMISLICMSTHKATAARCLSYHQAASGQPAIRALAMAPLRRLALSVLFTIATNSYQTTCTVSERTFNKRQHANARHGVDFSLFTHYDTCPLPRPNFLHFHAVFRTLWPYNRLALPFWGWNTSGKSRKIYLAFLDISYLLKDH